MDFYSFFENPTEWLRRYMAARGRFTVKQFNLLLLCAFLPVLLLSVQGYWGTAMGITQTVGKAGSGDIAGLLNVLTSLNTSAEGASFWQKYGLPLLPYILYGLLFPAIIMRLRDAGKPSYLAGILALGFALGILKHVADINVPLLPRLVLGGFEFWIFTVLSLKGSVPLPPVITPPR